MTKKQERHIVATIGTLLFLLVVALLLWFIRLKAVAPEQAEGIEIAFVEPEEMEEEEISTLTGDAAYAEEPTDAAPAAPATPAEEVATSSTPAAPPEHIVSEEETLALERARKEKEELEAAERARKEKEAEAIAKARQMGDLFSKTDGTNTSGSGTAQGGGQKGNPVGHGSSGSGSWTLDGRGIKGNLPQPSKDFKQEGTVIVRIRVNAEGNVIQVIDNLEGTISDKATRKLAVDAAYKAKFSALSGANDQIGTITYNFKFN